MFVRAAIVTLIILNLGVTLWWATQPPQPLPDMPVHPTGVPKLFLLHSPTVKTLPSTDTSTSEPSAEPDTITVSTAPEVVQTPPPETPPVVISTPEPAPPVASTPPEPPPAEIRCASLGPFTSRALAENARSLIASDINNDRLREVTSTSNESFRVLLPTGSRQVAQALVERISAAGFSDYFIITQGEEIHSIALGRFRNRKGAEQRLADLAISGFQAQIITDSNDTPAQWWLDIRYPVTQKSTRLHQKAGASRQQSLDCASMR